MPFWFDAYWLDCSHLSDAEHGRYLLVMKELWTAPRQRLPNDDDWLARRFRRSAEAVRNEIRPILKEFCQCDGNWWTQKRLSEEFAYVTESRARQSERAKTRWNKEKSAFRGNAGLGTASTPTKDSESLTFLPNLESVPSESQPSTVPSAKPKTRRTNEYPEAFQQFWLAYPKRSTDTKAGAFKAWDKARKAGTDLGALHEGTLRYAAYVDLTGCEKAHVQTWINREGWTASYANTGNGHARPTTQRPSAIQDFWRRHGRDSGSAGGSADAPVASDPPPRRG